MTRYCFAHKQKCPRKESDEKKYDYFKTTWYKFKIKTRNRQRTNIVVEKFFYRSTYLGAPLFVGIAKSVQQITE